MKSAYLLSIVLLSAFASAAAQDRTAVNPAVPPVQAPPTLDDPGTPAMAQPAPAAAANSAADSKAAPAAAKADDSPGLPAEVQAAANVAELPVVTVRQQGTDTVEEYRKHGKLYFVRVLSNAGPTKYYIDDPSQIPPDMMRQLSGPSGVVQPVYYKLFEWK